MNRQRGQALTELALILPLFAGLLMVFAFWARLAICRLSLIQLTRDSAVALARDARLWNCDDPSKQLAVVRTLAEGKSGLDPQAVEMSLEPLAAPDDTWPEGLKAVADSGMGKLVRELVLGKKLVLSYHIEFRGLAGRLFPQGLWLNESVALQGDPWDLCNSGNLFSELKHLFHQFF